MFFAPGGSIPPLRTFFHIIRIIFRIFVTRPPLTRESRRGKRRDGRAHSFANAIHKTRLKREPQRREARPPFGALLLIMTNKNR